MLRNIFFRSNFVRTLRMQNGRPWYVTCVLTAHGAVRTNDVCVVQQQGHMRYGKQRAQNKGFGLLLTREDHAEE